MCSTPEEQFNEWYDLEHGTGWYEIETDEDEIVEDESFDDPESV